MVKKIKLRRIAFLSIFIFIVLPSIKISYAQLSRALEHQSDDPLDLEQIKEYVHYFSSLGTRVDGYKGNLEAGDFIERTFSKYLDNVIIQNYSAAIPYDEGSYIILNNSLKINAYALWPNGAQTSKTPEEGITGHLIYVGDGDLSDFDGLNVTDSIILMDFNSGMNWINAAKLGVKAVIFIAPDETNAYESLTKSSPVPIYFPRLFVNQSSGILLKDAASKGVPVTVHSRIQWREIYGRNIIGVLNGTSYPNDIIIVSAHYDSWSVTPALSPAAEDSISISILLELARILSKNRPARTFWFVAMSGFWEGLIGPASFVEENLFSQANGRESRIWMQIALDISSETASLDALYTGGDTSNYPHSFLNWGENPSSAQRYMSWITPKIRNYLSRAGIPGEAVSFNFRGSYDWGTQTKPYLLASEVVSQTGTLGFTLRTQYSARNFWFTPLNDTKYINWRNVGYQANVIQAIVEGFAKDEDWPFDWSAIAPQRMRVAAGTTLSFITLYGRVVEFNSSISWYTAVPKALVRMCTPAYNNFLYWHFLIRHRIADENGNFKFYGLTAYHYTWKFDAWKFNQSDGSIIYAIDNGIYGTLTGMSGGIRDTAQPVGHPWQILLPIFKCKPITLFDIRNPKDSSKSQLPDLRMLTSFKSISTVISVYDYETRSIPVFYGTYYAPAYDLAVVFVVPSSRVVLSFNMIGKMPMLILTNSTIENTEGSGYFVNKPLTITYTAYRAAKDLFYVAYGRYMAMKKHFVVAPGAEKYLSKAEELIKSSTEDLVRLNYSKGYSKALLALAYASQAYSDQVMPLVNDATASILFFSFLIIPFSIFFEALVFHASGNKRILTIAIIMSLVFGIFYFIHPAFTVMSNSTMAILGVGMALFTLFIVWIFIGQVNDILVRSSEEKLGVHAVRGETIYAVIHSLSVAVDNMRRRKLSTLLTFGIILSLAIANTALTSTSIGAGIQFSNVYGSNFVDYNGILIKSSYAIPPDILDEPLIRLIEGISENNYTVNPRVWCYPPAKYSYGAVCTIISQGGTLSDKPFIFLGLTDKESDLLFKKWVNGTSHLLGFHSAIITQNLAEMLKLKVGDEFSVLGVPFNFTVVGILHEDFVAPSDFDGLSIIPINQIYSQTISKYPLLTQPGAIPQPAEHSSLIIIPWKTAYELGGYIASISILPEHDAEYDELLKLAERITLATGRTTFIGYEGSTQALTRITTYSLLGYNVLIPLLIISSFSIANRLIGNVRMRLREIYVYSSVGLSPRGALMMFLTESLAYAFIGSILGYLFGFAFNQVSLSILPEEFAFNYSSLFIIISLGILILACLLSSIYPSIIASRMITPSFERRWKISTKPIGDVWTLQFPFKLTDIEEAKGVLRYLQEYFREMGLERAAYRIFTSPKLDSKASTLEMTVNLTPLELGVTQKATIKFSEEAGTYIFNCILERKSGDYNLWVTKSYYFIDDLRKQFLLWRSLPPDKRMKYMREG